jgi:CRP/FNR family transcriptional regulator
MHHSLEHGAVARSFSHKRFLRTACDIASERSDPGSPAPRVMQQPHRDRHSRNSKVEYPREDKMKTTGFHDDASTDKENGQCFPGVSLCHACALFDLCRQREEPTPALPPLNAITKHPRVLAKGEFLFRVGDPFRGIFLIKSGSLKSSILSHDGGVQILRFALPGELLGINAIAAAHHPSDAVALEPAQLCEVPFAQLEALAAAHPPLQRRLLHALSDEIARDEKFMAMLGHQRADVRLADCLLDFHQRCHRPGHAAASFRLPMSRQDLADYLGLSLETVSRLLSRFQKSKLLHVQGRQMRLLDVAGLQSICSAGVVSSARRA